MALGENSDFLRSGISESLSEMPILPFLGKALHLTQSFNYAEKKQKAAFTCILNRFTFTSMIRTHLFGKRKASPQIGSVGSYVGPTSSPPNDVRSPLSSPWSTRPRVRAAVGKGRTRKIRKRQGEKKALETHRKPAL